MNKNEKTQRGITLIALVITIIVMLILVGVTISMSVNGGLFNYAGNAVSDTNTKLQEESQLAEGGVKVGDTWYNTIDEYLLASGNKGDLGNGITASTVQSDLTTYLGQKIEYGATYTDASSYGNGEWEIFYADGEHIYIITRGHLAVGQLTITGYNGTSDFTEDNLSTKYKAVAAGLFNKTYDPDKTPALQYAGQDDLGPYSNMKATQYLLDSTVNLWANLANNEYADWAIGAPTFELFVSSYNAYYPDNAVTLEAPTGYGYANPLSESGSIPSGTYLNHSENTYYWLASPSSDTARYSMRLVAGGSSRVQYDGYSGYETFRPVVCLSSDIQITWDKEKSAYTISRAS